MATKRSSTKKQTIPQTDSGEPNVYELHYEREMRMDDIAELIGEGVMATYRLLWKQEPEFDPSVKINTKRPKEKVAAELAKLRENGVRWERLMARTGYSKAEVMALVAEHNGVEPDELKRQRTAADEDDAPAKSKTAKSKAKQKALEADEADDEDEVDEDVDVDDEDEDEVEEAPKPKPARARRGRSRSAK